jgi:CubicO group peptidase (beta-lactamase class C family)
MKNICLFLVLIAFISLLSCSESNSEIIDDLTNNSEIYFPPINSDTWETNTVNNLNWNTTAVQPLYDFLEEKETKAFIILKDGKIVIEQYFNGADAEDNNAWNSAGKTLSAFMIGIAQEENYLNIDDSSSDYLGSNWSSLTSEQEFQIKIKHHLTMTTGLDYTNTLLMNCTLPECLTYVNNPGNFWYYHNATYTLNQHIITEAVGFDFTTYFNTKLRDKIGMQGTWVNLGFNNIYFSTARSMARFGLLNLNKGMWDETPILTDLNYFSEMTTTSQDMNKSYGYLWWLNGKVSYRSPGLTIEFNGELIQNAPDDLIAGLGKDDQKLYVIPSKNLVIVRMGDNTGESLLGLSSFDNVLWSKLNDLMNN